MNREVYYNEFHVLMAASTKVPVFWVVAPRDLAEVSDFLEVLDASIIRVMAFIKSCNLIVSWVS